MGLPAVETVTEGLALRLPEAEALDAQIGALIDKGALMAIELGRLLDQMARGRGYEKLGLETFDAYLAARFGKKKRWAQQQITAAKAIEASPELQAAAGELGPTKVRIIAQAAPENVRGLVEKAKWASTRELEEDLRRRPRQADPEALRPWRVMLCQGQEDVVERALRAAARETDSESKGVNLEAICADFLSGRDG